MKTPIKVSRAPRQTMLWASLIALTVIQTARPGSVAGLRIRAVEIPAAVANGTQVSLVCHYELAGGEQLYSVKWYRNYVEFFRFQLAATSGEDSHPSGAANVKNEFELEGINLDLNKSNGTHVHLRQVSLASEATYKCEVSADSPTFATISLERQMKVYVLPKQKLTILDNNQNNNNNNNQNQNQNQNHSTATANQPQDQQPQRLAYQLNDLVNFTCLAGPSKPAAKLTWLVNELPISASSKWLTGQQIKLPGADLTESRLTLAFKLQLSHLTRSTAAITNTHARNNNNNQRLSGLYPIKLSCVAKLSVEFTSETNILVSGGKTLIKRRQQQEPSSVLPLPSSLIEASGGLLSTSSMSSHSDSEAAKMSTNNGNKYDHYYPIYRWPRPAAWPAGSSLAPPGGPDPSPQDQVRTTINRSGRQILVWTSKQLRAQAEHIDQMLRKSHPNDIGPPLIEAKTQLSDDMEEADQDETTTTTRPADSETTTDSFGLMDDERATTTSNTEDPLATSDYDRRSSSSSSIFRDYELNEQVQFACTPQVGSYSPELARSVQVKWLINDKEINGSQVNAFDGSKFFHEYRERRAQNFPVETTTIAPITTTTISDDLGLGAMNNHQAEPGQQVKFLSVELTPNLFQLKELNLKCRTIVEQPLIEYESQVMATVSTSPFIQVDQNQQQQQANIKFRPSNRGSSYHKYSRHNSSNPIEDGNINISATPRSRHKNNERYRTRQQASSSSSVSGRLIYFSPLVSCFYLMTSSILTIQFVT